MTDQQPLYRNGDVTPRPDPTVLTSVALAREVVALNNQLAALKEALETRLDGDRRVFETRLVGMDSAIILVREVARTLEPLMDRRIGNLEALHDQKFITVGERFATVGEQFNGIQNQFTERDVRVKESSAAGETKVNAAFLAAEKAGAEQNKSLTAVVEKSEQSIKERISQLETLGETNNRSINEKVIAIDTRVTRIESLGLGTAAAQSNQRADTSLNQQSSSHTNAVTFGIISSIIAASVLVLEIARIATGH